MSQWFVYILGCRDGSYYTGITVDIPRRLTEHNSPQGGSRYTRSRQPLELLAAWEVAHQGQALQIEQYIKRHMRREQKERLIENPDLLSVLFPGVHPQTHPDTVQ